MGKDLIAITTISDAPLVTKRSRSSLEPYVRLDILMHTCLITSAKGQDQGEDGYYGVLLMIGGSSDIASIHLL